MLNEERQRAILDLLRRDGRVLVVDLARQLHTSQVTIRKDLDILHVKGRIHRTHGGALPARDGAPGRSHFAQDTLFQPVAATPLVLCLGTGRVFVSLL
jgi:DeoR/GlpR family transcriptional regulator of sugar metabolism